MVAKKSSSTNLQLRVSPPRLPSPRQGLCGDDSLPEGEEPPLRLLHAHPALDQDRRILRSAQPAIHQNLIHITTVKNFFCTYTKMIAQPFIHQHFNSYNYTGMKKKSFDEGKRYLCLKYEIERGIMVITLDQCSPLIHSLSSTRELIHEKQNNCSIYYKV